MSAYLLTWNPNAWPWPSEDMEQSIDAIKNEGVAMDTWSAGVTKRIAPNDRFYLMQLGGPKRGIVGAGFIASSPDYGPHYNGEEGAQALYCQVEFNQLVNPADNYLVTHQELTEQFPEFNWSPRASGVSIPLSIAEKLDEMLEQQTTPNSPTYEEGALRRILSSRPERNPQARADCLAHYGFDCVVCGFNFGDFYGEAGEGLIHVHHLEPLGASSSVRLTDPVRDLRPVCANCHALIHRHQQPLSIEQVKSLINC